MKKLINDPINVVSEMLLGLSKSNKNIIYYPDTEVVARKEKGNKVGLVSGGGSGHEPAHAGYVGEGMLDAAVAGNVFASPSPDRILQGIRAADSGRGVLLIVKNYSGDVMNFEIAKDIAESEGFVIEYVIVKDDVAVPDSTYSTGRRGIAGTIFVHKIAGAMAERNSPLVEVKRVAEKVIAQTRSIGMAMSPCVLPEVGTAGFSLGDDEIEIGMGIHGEPGVERVPVQSAKEIVRILLEKILGDFDYYGGEVAMMVNGMGGTPLMELLIAVNDACEYLSKKDIKVVRVFTGNFMTSLEMAGCSISLLKLDDELLSLLDEPCNAPAFKI